MTKPLDYVLDRITMYRLVLYVLIGLIGMAAILAYVHQLSFSPLVLLLSTAFLVVMCWAANWLLAAIFEVPTNMESAIITALILALIIDPAKSLGDLQFLGWAAILAMSSKYMLSLYNKHLFNPAAIAVVITAPLNHRHSKMHSHVREETGEIGQTISVYTSHRCIA